MVMDKTCAPEVYLRVVDGLLMITVHLGSAHERDNLRNHY